MTSNVWIQSVKFGIVGIANTLFGLFIIYAAMFVTDGNIVASNIAGYACGTLLSFALNRGWTFQSDQPARRVLPRYVVVLAVSYVANLAAVLTATHKLGVNPYFSQPVGIAVYTALMFFGCRLFVFRSSPV